MKKILILIPLFSILLFSSGQLMAQYGCTYNVESGWHSQGDPSKPCVNTILTAVPFLRIVPEARSGAMGDAGIAISPDANAMHFNASKLAFAEKDLGISVTYTPWLRALGLNDVYMAYLSAFKKIDKIQSLGFSLRFFSLGSITFTDDTGAETGDGNPNEFEIGLSYARQLSPNFSVAIGGKFIYSNLAGGQTIGDIDITPGMAGAADISMTYNKAIKVAENETNLTVGLAISNIGTKISYTNSINKDFIPTNLGLGAAWEFNFDEYNSLTFATDINKLLVPTPCLDNPETPENECDLDGVDGLDYRQKSPISGVFSSFGDAPGGFSEELQELMFSFGLEYWYDKQFAVRAGYYTENQAKGARRFFTVGLGLKYNIFGLNFSYLIPTTNNRNPLDNTLRFSLLFDFEAFNADEN